MKAGIAIDTMVLLIVALVAGLMIIMAVTRGFGGFKRTMRRTESVQTCNAMCENLRTIAMRYDDAASFCNDNMNLLNDYKNSCEIICSINVGEKTVTVGNGKLEGCQ